MASFKFCVQVPEEGRGSDLDATAMKSRIWRPFLLACMIAAGMVLHGRTPAVGAQSGWVSKAPMLLGAHRGSRPDGHMMGASMSLVRRMGRAILPMPRSIRRPLTHGQRSRRCRLLKVIWMEQSRPMARCI